MRSLGRIFWNILTSLELKQDGPDAHGRMGIAGPSAHACHWVGPVPNHPGGRPHTPPHTHLPHPAGSLDAVIREQMTLTSL